MNFHFICHPQYNQKTRDRLKKACSKRNLNFVPHHWADKSLADPQPRDILYRASINPKNILLEQRLLNQSVATLYKDNATSYIDQFSSQLTFLAKANVPTPKTIYINSPNRQQLENQVNQLGGFPVVLKVIGGSHGIGVIITDSKPSLFSMIDYLLSKKEMVIMRSYIKTNSSARLVVLGHQVISSYNYRVPPDDFRSNTGSQPQVTPANYSAAVQKIAVDAVQAQLVEFGGVDILFDSDDQPYVTEVNFPCNIIRAEEATKIKVADLMIDFLINKADKI